MGQDAYATAASEYTRAAELSAESDEPVGRKRAEAHKLHSDAANAWRQMGETGRAGESMLKAAFGLLIGSGEGGAGEGSDVQSFGSEERRKTKLMSMDRKALKAIEEAVEAHVPDPLNRYRSFRQTGTSAYADPSGGVGGGEDPEGAEEALRLARQNLVRKSHAHETVSTAVSKFVRYGEYPSALYATGATSAILEADDFNTISLHRAYAAETICTLALGDVISADEYFLNVHLQKNSYLSSRECKLSEDLIRAVKSMDLEALEEARSPGGSNRPAMANLDPAMRALVADLRISGRAKAGGGGDRPARVAPSTEGGANLPPERKPPPGTRPTLPPPSQAQEPPKTLHETFAELDDLMGDMGLNSDDDEEGVAGVGVGRPGAGALPTEAAYAPRPPVEEEDLDDDEFDLR